MDEQPSLLDLTALIVTNHVSNNSVHYGDVPKLISAVHGALARLGAPAAPEPAKPEHKPAVSVRKSLASDQHILSLIDGKPYRALRRHLASHGLTDKEYRARYNLEADYPMVSRAYSAARSVMAQAIGLGRKAGKTVSEAASSAEAHIESAVAPAVSAAKRKTKKVVDDAREAATAPAKRRRKADGQPTAS